MALGRGWCEKCQRGVEGEIGKLCMECKSRGESNPGILKEPKQVEKEKLAHAAAMKLVSKSTVRPYKSNEDVKREAKEEAKAEIIAMIQSGELKIPAVKKETK
jgi:hypothetical protein